MTNVSFRACKDPKSSNFAGLTIKKTEGAACGRSLSGELRPPAAELRLRTALLFLGVWLLLDHV